MSTLSNLISSAVERRREKRAMNKIHELSRRLRMLFYRKQFHADLEEEMRLHLALREQ